MLATTAAATLVFTACGPVNAGDPAALEYQAWVDDVEGVESADVNGMSPWPFQGEVYATVRLEELLGAPEVVEILEELRTFTFDESTNATLEVDVVYVAGDAELTMAGSWDSDPETWAALVTDPALRETATVVVTTLVDDDASLVAVTRGDAVEGAAMLDAAVERHLGVTVADHRVRDAASTSDLEGERTGPAREVYERIAAEFSITGGQVREGEVWIGLPALAPVVRAEVVSRITALSVPGVVVEVHDPR
ncbi:hypothetical protein [Sanguibacter sp. 25GB23B1]|uniref:hypothetical protein n=1 Tax=unclassified Sanguibacter TaxID=2645534 RepID=UPI0032AE81B6